MEEHTHRMPGVVTLRDVLAAMPSETAYDRLHEVLEALHPTIVSIRSLDFHFLFFFSSLFFGQNRLYKQQIQQRLSS
jgi:hypothetical protein